MNDQWSLIEAGHLLHILDRMPPNVWLQNRIRLLQYTWNILQQVVNKRWMTMNIGWTLYGQRRFPPLLSSCCDVEDGILLVSIRLRKGVSLSPTRLGPAPFLNPRITVDVIWTVASNRSESQVTYRPKLQELYISFFYSLNYSPLLRVFCYFLTFWNGDKNCCHSCFEIIVGHKMTVKPL